MEQRASLVLVLHSHIPYCRKQGVWPFGEEWVFEAMADTYVPMLDMLAAVPLRHDESSGSRNPILSVAVSPVLCEQLRDDYMTKRFVEYIDSRIAAAEADVAHHLEVHDDIMAGIARGYLERCIDVKHSFLDRWGSDLVGAFRYFAAEGIIEVLATAATHAYLPLLDDEGRVRAQLKTGILSCEHHFGLKPRAAWLPELGYSPGAIDSVLQELGIECVLVDPSSLATSDRPLGAASLVVYTLARTGMSVLVRDDTTVAQVWSRDTGYPGDGSYREFHKRHDVSGIPYWRVTSKLTDLNYKQLYSAEQAAETVRRHAEHFCEFIADRAQQRPGAVIVAPFDMELFGHWWHEGIAWLSHVIRILSEGAGPRLASVSAASRDGASGGVVELVDGSWGEGAVHSAWANERTEAMWRSLKEAQSLRSRLEQARAQGRFGNGEQELASQACRELLLAEASDWPFLVSVGQAADYAMARFDGHIGNFTRLAMAAMDGADDAAMAALSDIAARDALFGWAPASYL